MGYLEVLGLAPAAAWADCFATFLRTEWVGTGSPPLEFLLHILALMVEALCSPAVLALPI
jgi:hypothetical protein